MEGNFQQMPDKYAIKTKHTLVHSRWRCWWTNNWSICSRYSSPAGTPGIGCGVTIHCVCTPCWSETGIIKTNYGNNVRQSINQSSTIDRQTPRQTGWSQYSAPLPGWSKNDEKTKRKSMSISNREKRQKARKRQSSGYHRSSGNLIF